MSLSLKPNGGAMASSQASRPEKKSKMEQERDDAIRRANQAADTIASLTKQVAELTAQVKILVSLSSQQAQVNDSADQARELCGAEAATKEPAWKPAPTFKLADKLPALGLQSAAVLATNDPRHQVDATAVKATTSGAIAGAALQSGGALSSKSKHTGEAATSASADNEASAAAMDVNAPSDNQVAHSPTYTPSSPKSKPSTFAEVAAINPSFTFNAIPPYLQEQHSTFFTVGSNPPGPSKRRASNSAEANEDSDGEAEGGFTVVKRGKQALKKARRLAPGMPAPPPARPARPQHNAAPSAAASNDPPRPAPLVLIGLTEEQQKSSSIYLQLHNFLRVDKALFYSTHMTKAGNIIIKPADDEASKSLLSAPLPTGLTIKPVEGSRKRLASPYVVLKGVPQTLDDEALKEATGFPCQRLRSAANNGQPTSMVRIMVTAEEQKKQILQNGIQLGHQRVRAVPYNGDSTALLCFKCCGVGHIAKACRETDRKCRRCGEAHLASSCSAVTPKCCNCGRDHESNHPSCPAIIAHKEERKAKTLTSAAKARQPADNVEALRLAACLASCLQAFSTKANLDIQQADINTFVAKGVRETFRVSLTGPHVKSLLLANAGSSDDQQ